MKIASKTLLLFALLCLSSVFCVKNKMMRKNNHEIVPNFGPAPENSTDSETQGNTTSSSPSSTDPSANTEFIQTESKGTIINNGLVHVPNLQLVTSFAVHHGDIIDGVTLYRNDGWTHSGGFGGGRSPVWLAHGDCITQFAYKIGTSGGTTRLLELVIATKHGHRYGPFGKGDGGRPWITTGTTNGQCATQVRGHASGGFVNNLFIPRGLRSISGVKSLYNKHWRANYGVGSLTGELTSRRVAFDFQNNGNDAYKIHTYESGSFYLRMAPWENPGVNFATAAGGWENWYVESINGNDCIRNAYHGFYFGVNGEGRGFAQYDCYGWESWQL